MICKTVKPYNIFENVAIVAVAGFKYSNETSTQEQKINLYFRFGGTRITQRSYINSRIMVCL